MIPISNSLTYPDLLAKYQPKLIKNEQEYRQALGIIEGMMSRSLTQDETTLFELLVLLIETYEHQNYPINQGNSAATLESLMYEFNLNNEHLLDIFGDVNTIEKVINGQQEISPSQGELLAEFFNRITPELALTSYHFLYRPNSDRYLMGKTELP